MRTAEMLIISDNRSGLGYMMQGYVNFYTQNFVIDHAMAGKKDIHPIAIQVMKEDGIDISAFRAKDIADITPSRYYYIIKLTGQLPQNLFIPESIQTFPFSFADPLTENKYEEVLRGFRSVREEIKKSCIEFAGNLSASLVGR